MITWWLFCLELEEFEDDPPSLSRLPLLLLSVPPPLFPSIPFIWCCCFLRLCLTALRRRVPPPPTLTLGAPATSTTLSLSLPPAAAAGAPSELASIPQVVEVRGMRACAADPAAPEGRFLMVPPAGKSASKPPPPLWDPSCRLALLSVRQPLLEEELDEREEGGLGPPRPMEAWWW